MPENEICKSCNYTLSDEQLEKIASLVSQKLETRVHLKIGKAVVDYFIVIITALGGAVYLYLKSKGLVE